jgi:hypothetical protein
VAVVTPAVLVAASGVETTDWLGLLSVSKYTVAVVPAGMLVAVMFIVSGELEFRVTSGMVKLPVGLAGTATPPMLVTITEGWPVDAGTKRLKGVAR